MTRILWLLYERAGHPDAVRYGANEEEVRFVLGLLEQSRLEREEMSRRLRRYVAIEQQRDLFQRRLVAVRGANGLFRPIGWKLAQWLRCVLPMSERTGQRVVRQLRDWLSFGSEERESKTLTMVTSE